MHRDSAASFNFIFANPPFGERGEAQFEDPDRDDHEKNAASYLLRRGLDLLMPGGLGVYIIPKGWHGCGGRSRTVRRAYTDGTAKSARISAIRTPPVNTRSTSCAPRTATLRA